MLITQIRKFNYSMKTHTKKITILSLGIRMAKTEGKKESRTEGYHQAILAMIDYNDLKDNISKRTRLIQRHAYLGI